MGQVDEEISCELAARARVKLDYEIESYRTLTLTVQLYVIHLTAYCWPGSQTVRGWHSVYAVIVIGLQRPVTLRLLSRMIKFASRPVYEQTWLVSCDDIVSQIDRKPTACMPLQC